MTNTHKDEGVILLTGDMLLSSQDLMELEMREVGFPIRCSGDEINGRKVMDGIKFVMNYLSLHDRPITVFNLMNGKNFTATYEEASFILYELKQAGVLKHVNSHTAFVKA